jgi:hypothetical protein
MKNYLSLDRFEGEIAVCIDDEQNKIEIHTADLPFKCTEGTVIFFENGKYEIDREETDRRKKEAEELLRQLME